MNLGIKSSRDGERNYSDVMEGLARLNNKCAEFDGLLIWLNNSTGNENPRSKLISLISNTKLGFVISEKCHNCSFENFNGKLIL